MISQQQLRAWLHFHALTLRHRIRPGPPAEVMDRELEEHNLFFIVGHGRSGTRFLASLLAQAEDARVEHEPCPADVHAALRGRLDSGFSHRYVRDYRKWFVYEAVRRAGCGTYGEVNSRLRHHVEALRQQIPGARFLRIFRDGRDVVRSMTARDLWMARAFIAAAGDALREDPAYAGLSAMDDFALACWIWRFDTGRLAARLPDFVRFDEILGDYERFTTGLLRPLGLELPRDVWERHGRQPRNVTPAHVVPHWSEWGPEHESTFWRICGDVMEQHGLAGP